MNETKKAKWRKAITIIVRIFKAIIGEFKQK